MSKKGGSCINAKIVLTRSLTLLLFFLAACGTTAAPAPVIVPTTVEASPTAVAPTPLPSLPTGTAGYPWWNDTIFYEIFVRSFYDSDGDGIGDLNGLIARLDYLQELGVSGLWLMPIMDSPSYHGYDVVDYYRVNPEYGTNEDFKRLVAEARARGIRIIVDLVLNHTSVEHPWFQEALDPGSERRDWYVWADEAPTYRGPWGQPVWHATPDGYYYGVFWVGMPDLNFENPAVIDEMLAITRFWLEEMGVDGFRLDAIKHLIEDGPIQENTPATLAWFEEFYTFYKGVNPDALAVGEVWSPSAEVRQYIGDKVDIAFEFDLAEAMINSANNGRRTEIAIAHHNIVSGYPPGQYATFLANHDQNRVLSQLGGDIAKAKVAATLQLTSPGVPFIYYGEEIGMRGIKPDENLRLPMQWEPQSGGGFTTGTPWRPLHRRYLEENVALQDNDPHSLLNHYRSLIRLRNSHDALRIGDWLKVDSSAPEVYAYLRQSEQELLLVLINLSDSPIANYRLDLKSGPFLGGDQATLLLGDGALADPAINPEGGFSAFRPLSELPAQSSFIIKIGQ